MTRHTWKVVTLMLLLLHTETVLVNKHTEGEYSSAWCCSILLCTKSKVWKNNAMNIFPYQLTSYSVVQKAERKLNQITIWGDHLLPLKQHQFSSEHWHRVFQHTWQVVPSVLESLPQFFCGFMWFQVDSMTLRSGLWGGHIIWCRTPCSCIWNWM